MRQQAYAIGCRDAKIAFSILPSEREGDVMTPIMGAMPIIGPGLAGATSAISAPKEDSGIASGLVTGLSSLVGGVGGSVLGGLAGIPLGLLLHKHFPAKYSLPTDPYIPLPSVHDALSKGTRVGQGMLGGTALGGILGSAGGAHLGRQAMKTKHPVREED